MTSVSFCETNPDQFDEIKELIGRKNAGFLGGLEDIVLFTDDDFTAQFPTLDSISNKLEDEGLQNLRDLAELRS
ncbi:MAG: hypothetical protein JW748_05520 [Anaerolineales bacterium]|nr:hypothetical protein [Anaerolineales bacterium]